MDRPFAAGGAVDQRIVHHNHMSIAGYSQIAFDPCRPSITGCLKSR
jgi:hypothetical protein